MSYSINKAGNGFYRINGLAKLFLSFVVWPKWKQILWGWVDRSIFSAENRALNAIQQKWISVNIYFFDSSCHMHNVSSFGYNIYEPWENLSMNVFQHYFWWLSIVYITQSIDLLLIDIGGNGSGDKICKWTNFISLRNSSFNYFIIYLYLKLLLFFIAYLKLNFISIDLMRLSDLLSLYWMLWNSNLYRLYTRQRSKYLTVAYCSRHFFLFIKNVKQLENLFR